MLASRSIQRRVRVERAFLILVMVLASITPVRAVANKLDPATARFAVYYGSAEVPGLFDRELVVLDAAAHPQLPPRNAPGYEQRRVLGYLSLGEIDKSRPYFDAMRRAGVLLGKVPAWPNARYVDLRRRQF